MKHVTGIHALNLPCSLITTGDWHQLAIDWKDVWYEESNDCLHGDWGIEKFIYNSYFKLDCEYHANHLRAILDLMYRRNYRDYLVGFRSDFICTDIYNEEFFEQVYKLHELSC